MDCYNKKVAYFGPAGPFTHLAAIKYFGEDYQDFSCFFRISESAKLLESGSVDFCVVPAENSTGGIVVDTLDLFLDKSIKVYDQVSIAIEQNLLSNSPRESISRIYSHPQSFLQCSEYLNNNFPDVELIPVDSNSKGAKVALTDKNGASIGPRVLCDVYGLALVEPAINDSKDNMTRFFILSNKINREPKRVSILQFTVKNLSGALCGVLNIFKEYSCNMTHISSRPSKMKNWDYMFVVEIENLPDSTKNEAMLEAIAEYCDYLNYVGSY